MQNATEMITKLDALIKESTNILITCHTGADPDALSSLIALRSILTTHYKKDKVFAVAERIPASLSFIPGYTEIVNGSILEALKKNGIELIICLDFSQLHLASKLDSAEIEEYIKKAGIPLVIIDHHPEAYQNIDSDVYLNVDPTSTAANLHSIFHNNLHLPILPKVADLLLYGIIADTNRFKYKYGAPSQATILHFAADLLDKSTLSIEEIATSMDRLDLEMLQIAATFTRNTKLLNKTFAYTTISVDDLDRDGLNTKKLGDAGNYMANTLISMIDTAQHGVVIYPHLLEENTYTVRFRSCNPLFPVDKYAKALGGGGHPQSSAARVKAINIEEALKIVLSVVN